MVSLLSSMPASAYSFASSSSDLKVPSSLAALLHGTLIAVGMWPARCDCSCGRCAGASRRPANSSGLRTSTRFFTPIAWTTSSRNARMLRSGALAEYEVFARTGTSFEYGRASSSHFLRPPSISLTWSWPYSLKYQYAYAANQLLLPPYSTTRSSLAMPRSERSAENCSWLTKSRRTGSCRSFFQSILTAPGMCPPSYAVVSSSTSTKTTPGASRFFSAQSAETSAVSRLIDSLPDGWDGGESAHGGFVAPRAGPWFQISGC